MAGERQGWARLRARRLDEADQKSSVEAMTAGSLARLGCRLQGLALPIPVGIGHRLQLIEHPQHPEGSEVGGDRGAGLTALHIGHGEAADAHPFGHVLQAPAAAQPGGPDVAPQPLQGLLQGRRGVPALQHGEPCRQGGRDRRPGNGQPPSTVPSTIRSAVPSAI